MDKAPLIKAFRPFVGCDAPTFPVSKAFYQALGFELMWQNEAIAEFHTGYGDQRFLLALHHGLERGHAGMLSFWVDDVDAWYRHLRLIDWERFPDARVAEPTVTEWDWKIAYVWDPFGWLLHIGQPVSELD